MNNIILEEQFHCKALSVFSEMGKKAKNKSGKPYYPRYYLRAVRNHGGMEYAKQILADPKKTPNLEGISGVTKEMILEYYVTLPEFRKLFTATEIAEAEKRVKELKI